MAIEGNIRTLWSHSLSKLPQLNTKGNNGKSRPNKIPLYGGSLKGKLNSGQKKQDNSLLAPMSEETNTTDIPHLANTISMISIVIDR
jgi:hypothetical protein